MAKTKTAGIRKTLEVLLKKVETLENQSFAQKLTIDELENKLEIAERLIKQVQENPFGIPTVNVPYVQTPAPMPPPPTVQLAYPPGSGIWGIGGGSGSGLYWPPNQPGIVGGVHTCTPSTPDYSGNVYCNTCGTYMSTFTYTALPTGVVASTSSTDVEDILDLDISWIVEDPQTK